MRKSIMLSIVSGCFIIGILSLSMVIADESLVASWHFDENEGSILHDSAGNNNGKIYGARWAGGINKNALLFDGIDDYVEIPSHSSLNISNYITIEVWINQASLDAVDRTIIAKGPPSTDVSNYDLRIYNGRIRFLFKDPAINWNAYSTINSEIIANTWMHVVVTYEWGSSDSIKIYINGERKPGEWIVGDGNKSVIPNAYSLYISGTGKLECFNGAIDEVNIWNEILDYNEIKAHYEQFISKTDKKSTSSFETILFTIGLLIAITIYQRFKK